MPGRTSQRRGGGSIVGACESTEPPSVFQLERAIGDRGFVPPRRAVRRRIKKSPPDPFLPVPIGVASARTGLDRGGRDETSRLPAAAGAALSSHCPSRPAPLQRSGNRQRWRHHSFNPVADRRPPTRRRDRPSVGASTPTGGVNDEEKHTTRGGRTRCRRAPGPRRERFRDRQGQQQAYGAERRGLQPCRRRPGRAYPARDLPAVRQHALQPRRPGGRVRPRADAAPARLPEVERHAVHERPHDPDLAHRGRDPELADRPLPRSAGADGLEQLRLLPGHEPDEGADVHELVQVLDEPGRPDGRPAAEHDHRRAEEHARPLGAVHARRL